MRGRRLTAWTMAWSEYRTGLVVNGCRMLFFMASRRGSTCSTMPRDPSCLSCYLLETRMPLPGERNQTFPLHYAWSWIISFTSLLLPRCNQRSDTRRGHHTNTSDVLRKAAQIFKPVFMMQLRHVSYWGLSINDVTRF